MTTTLDFDEATRFDRYTTDVNTLYKRLRKDYKGLKKMKVLNEGVELYVLFYEEDSDTNYLVS